MAISAVSLLYLIGLTEIVSARGLELSNDVNVSWSNGPLQSACEGTTACQRLVIGAPRLIRAASNAGNRLRIVVRIGPLDENGREVTAPTTIFRLDLIVRKATPECLERVPPFGCLSRLSFKEIRDQTGFTLAPSDLPLKLTLEDFVGELPSGDQIITVEASGRLLGANAPMTITLSGPGHEVIVDRVGDLDDFHPGDASDIPARSTEVVRALNRLESALLPKQIVELDELQSSVADLAVGFTHAFDLPPDATIHDATLTLHLKTNDVSNDFILLDRAVRNVGRVATRPLPIPLIFLRDLKVSDPGQSNTYDVSLNLTRVPIRVLTPEGLSPPQLNRLTGDLTDGRLNVIVVGRSTVDYSDLTIALNDPPRSPRH